MSVGGATISQEAPTLPPVPGASSFLGSAAAGTSANPQAGPVSPRQAGSTPLTTAYSTGFEKSEGFNPGTFTGGNGWGVQWVSGPQTQPAISTVHPASGEQSLRWNWNGQRGESKAWSPFFNATGPEVVISLDMCTTWSGNISENPDVEIGGYYPSGEGFIVGFVFIGDKGRVGVNSQFVNLYAVNGAYETLKADIHLDTQTAEFYYHNVLIYQGGFYNAPKPVQMVQGVVISDDSSQISGQTFEADNLVVQSNSQLKETAFLPPATIEGQPFNNTVYTFSDVGINLSRYTAIVEWGDGQVSTITSTPNPAAGQIVATSSGRFAVVGIHTYADEILPAQNRTFRVTVKDGPNTIGNARTPFVVADAPLTAGKLTPPKTTEGTSLVDKALFHFNDGNTRAPASDFTATINWGDGTSSVVTGAAGQIVATGGGGFDVRGSHTYTEEILLKDHRTFSITVSDHGGSSTRASSDDFTVADAPLTAGSLTPPARAAVGIPLTRVRVFHFTDGYTKAPASDFTATIAWGDGTSSTVSGKNGQIVATGNGGFDVFGWHTYSKALQNAVFSVAVADIGGKTTGASGAVTVKPQVWTFLGIGDFNGDGTADSVWQEQNSAAVCAWLVKNGQITQSVVLGYADLSTARLLAIGDFNGDKTDDLVWQNKSTGSVSDWLIKNASVVAMKTPGSASANWSVLGVGDFNHDGTDDLLWRNQNSGATAMWLFSNGLAGSTSPGTPPAGSKFLAIGDFNGDKTDDVAWQNPSTGLVTIWLIRNGTVGATTTPGGASAAWKMLGVGDYNHDGIGDMAWRNQNTGAVAIWLFRSTGYARTTNPGTPPAGTITLGVGDFNADGTSDLLWWNQANGAVSAWLMSNGLNARTLAVGTARPADWRLLGMGDFNHDGTTDLFWQNRNNGGLSIWLVNRSAAIRQELRATILAERLGARGLAALGSARRAQVSR